jgi:hypothetical protein
MEEQGEIIVFRHYDNPINANIAKTKLDAYGIPCFLTEENMSNLYPGQHLLAFKIRLHLFAGDEERARQVLIENDLVTDSDTASRCPKCNSHRTTRDFPKDSGDNLALIFFGVLFPHKKVNRCLDCDYEF